MQSDIDIDTNDQQVADNADGAGKKGQASENKREKFKRLAVKRVEKAIASISLIGNLANRNSYDYGEDDIGRILEAIRAEVDRVEAQFNAATGRVEKPKFSL